MPKVVKASDLRNHLSDVLDSVMGENRYILIARKNEVDAVIVDIDFFEELLASLSPKYVKSIKEARRDFKKGDVFSHEEVFGKL
jgi:prevent-host-death family protein